MLVITATFQVFNSHIGLVVPILAGTDKEHSCCHRKSCRNQTALCKQLCYIPVCVASSCNFYLKLKHLFYFSQSCPQESGNINISFSSTIKQWTSDVTCIDLFCFTFLICKTEKIDACCSPRAVERANTESWIISCNNEVYYHSDDDDSRGCPVLKPILKKTCGLGFSLLHFQKYLLFLKSKVLLYCF